MTMTSAAGSAPTRALPVDIEAFVSAADDWPQESPAVQAERQRIVHRGQVVKAYCIVADAAALVAAALVALGAGVVIPTSSPG